MADSCLEALSSSRRQFAIRLTVAGKTLVKGSTVNPIDGQTDEEPLPWRFPSRCCCSRLCSISGRFKEAFRACGAFEWVTWIYFLWLNAAILVFRGNLGHATNYFALHLAIVCGTVVLAW